MKKVLFLILIAASTASCSMMKTIGDNMKSNSYAKAASHAFRLRSVNIQLPVDSIVRNNPGDSTLLTALTLNK